MRERNISSHSLSHPHSLSHARVVRRSRRSKCRPQTTLSEQKEAKNKSTKVSASSVFSPSSVRFCILFCHPKVNRDNESNTFILLLSPFSRSSPIPFLYLFCDPDLLLVLHLPYPILHFILKQKQPENESTKAASFLLSLFSIVFGILLCEPKQFSSLIFFFFCHFSSGFGWHFILRSRSESPVWY